MPHRRKDVPDPVRLARPSVDDEDLPRRELRPVPDHRGRRERWTMGRGDTGDHRTCPDEQAAVQDYATALAHRWPLTLALYDGGNPGYGVEVVSATPARCARSRRPGRAR